MKITKLFCLFCLITSLMLGMEVIFGKKKDLSATENRALKSSLNITADSFSNNTLSSEFSSFFKDQFPFRQGLIHLTSRLERLMLKRENNSVIFGKDGFLIARHDYEDNNIIRSNIASVSSFLEKNSNARLFVAPRAIDVLKEKLPLHYPYYHNEKIYNELSWIDYYDPRELFRTSYSDKLWYKTDHHWSTDGAYLFYTAICREYGIEAYPEEFFRRETVSCDFRGTSHSKAMIDLSSDDIVLYRFQNDENFTLTYPTTNNVQKGFYDFSQLEKKDKYQIFLGGNTDIIEINENTSISKPKILLIKDSFANSVSPFLALHFDIELIDLRYYKGSLSRYIEDKNFEHIIILCGIDTLATDRSITALSN